jgi:hypothetical protein
VSLRHSWSPLEAAKWEPGGAVIWEASRAGAGSARGVGFLASWWMRLSHTRIIPVPEGQGSSHSTWSWSQAGPDGWGGDPVIPCMAGAQQGLMGSGLRGRSGYPSKLWDGFQAVGWHRLVARIPVVVDLAAWPRGRYSGVVWVWQLEAGAAEGWVSHHVRSGTELWPGTVWGAEWSSGSAHLWGGDLAGQLFFYKIMGWRSLLWSKSLECPAFGSPWSFTSVRCISSFSAGFLGQEFTRSVAFPLLPSSLFIFK